MIRRLFTAAFAISLLLSVATGVLWVRSYWTIDELYREAGPQPHPNLRPDLNLNPPLPDIIDWHSTTFCLSLPGAIDFTRQYEVNILSVGAGPPNTGWEWSADTAAGSQRTWRDYWFACSYYAGPSGSTLHVHFPDWAVASIAAAAAALLSRGRFLGRRGGALCRICGYDLRASIGRCPECGTPILLTINKTEA